MILKFITQKRNLYYNINSFTLTLPLCLHNLEDADRVCAKPLNFCL